MPREFCLPDLGSGLKEGEIVRWLVEVGQQVTTDDLLCEVETEKAVIEVPVPYDGQIVSLAADVGASVKVGAVLATIALRGEAGAPPPDAGQPRPDNAVTAESEAAAETRAREPAARRFENRLLRAMPAVRRLAAEYDLDLSLIEATGRNGRLTKGDVLAFMKRAPEVRESHSHALTRAPATQGPARRPAERRKLSKLRKTIADRMTRSWQEIPHVFARMEVDASGLLRARASLAEVYGHKVPVEAMLIRAVLPALREHPEFNASLEGEDLLLHRHYSICLAIDTEEGLVLPTVHEADRFTMADLARHVGELIPRAVQRKASPEELTGGTFTVNNIGALGVLIGTSIIPPGTTAILSVGRAVEKAVARHGEITSTPMLEVTLSFDHRVIDGGLAQKFMALIKRNLEDAVRLLA